MRREAYSGVVYIEPEWEVVPRALPIEGHWELEGLDRPAEEGPGWATAEEAIDWGRKRAPEVFLRVHLAVYSYRYVQAGDALLRLHAPVDDRYVIYCAGETQWAPPLEIEGEEEIEPEDVRRWPGAADTRDTDVLPDYGGEVFLVQWQDEMENGGFLGYTARWDAVRNGRQGVAEVHGPAWAGDFPAAVEWGRERAPYVLVCDGPRTFGYESAGEADPPRLTLPRWLGPSDIAALNLELRDFDSADGSWTVHVPDQSTKSFPIPEEIEPAGGLPPPRTTDDPS